MNASLTVITTVLLLAAVLMLPSSTAAQSTSAVPVPEGPMLLDHFADEAPPAIGRWSLSTDRVMGGLSDGRVSIEDVEGRRAMRMTGSVRLENNGGFVQNSLQMGEMDASDYDGVYLGARAAQPGSYYLFVRTSSTWMPWSYYSAKLEVGSDWNTLVVPWSKFENKSVRSDLDPSRIRSISVVAYGEAMQADIAVDQIGLYGPMPQFDMPRPDPRTMMALER